MASARKYSDLPDFDHSQDIYETPELTDDTSTHPTSATLRSNSSASSRDTSEDEASGIDRRKLDADEARTHFLPANQRDSYISNRVTGKRKSYRSVSRQRRKGGPAINGIINGVEVPSDEEESLERKLVRLHREVTEVREALDQKNVKTDGTTAQLPLDDSKSLDSLTQVLENIDIRAVNDGRGAAKRLTQGLIQTTKSNRNATNVPANGTVLPHEDGSSYTVNYAPAFQESHTLSKVSDFDTRLALIEAALGIESIPLPTQNGLSSKAVIQTLDSLDRHFSTLTASTDSSLDKISRKVRQLTHDAEKLERARRSAKAAQDALSPSSTKSLQGTTLSDDDETVHTDEDAEQQSKINALYGTLPTIEALAPLLPSVLDRLRSLRSLHADAASASQALTKVENRQDEMKQELQGWRDGLEKVEKAMEQGGEIMKANTDLVETWVKELEERMRKFDD